MTGQPLTDGMAREFVLAGVVDGSEVALERLGADFASAELARFLAELLVDCVELRWPDGTSLPELATYVRGSGGFNQEGPDVSPMLIEAVMRAAAGDMRFIEGVGAEALLEHMAVALRIIVPDLQSRGVSAAKIARPDDRRPAASPSPSDQG